MCYISNLLNEKPASGEEEFEIKWSAASLYAGTYPFTSGVISLLTFPSEGGADTVSSITNIPCDN